jgi:hypothetical protein
MYDHDDDRGAPGARRSVLRSEGVSSAIGMRAVIPPGTMSPRSMMMDRRQISTAQAVHCNPASVACSYDAAREKETVQAANVYRAQVYMALDRAKLLCFPMRHVQFLSYPFRPIVND